MFRTIGTYLGTLLAGIVIGSLVMLLTMNKHEAQKVTAEARQVVSTTADNIVKNVEKDVQVEKKVAEGKQNTDTVKAAVMEPLKPQKETVYVKVTVPGKAEPQTCPPVTGDSVIPLSVAGVRLLNDLRAYRTVDLTGVDPTESETSAGVTVAQFVDNDTDVVGLYNELATRHNALVDEVIAYMKRQAASAEASK